MLKNLLFTFIAITAIGITTANAQCTPDPQYTQPGVYPDSATGFDPAYVGQAYSQLITNVVPVDTCVEIIPGFPCQTLSMDSIVVTNVTGLPASMGYACSPNNCVFVGGTSGCMIITGTPTAGEVGSHQVIVTLDAYVGGTGIPNPFTVDYYYIEVLQGVGVNELVDNKFAVRQNRPNPFGKTTDINYTVGKAADVEFKVINMLGAVVYKKTFEAEKGDNTIKLSSASLSSGVYMYSLKNGEKTITHRMVVNK